MSHLVLTSPDLLLSPLTRFMAKQFTTHIGPSRIPMPTLLPSSVNYKLRELHNNLLQKQQKNWYQLVASPYELLQKDDVVEQLNNIAAEPESSASLMINDPLLCFFLPAWESLNEPTSVAFHYSDPLECAIELQNKWRFPLNFGLALWESYILAACKNIAGNPHVLISSNKLREYGATHLRTVAEDLASLGETKLGECIVASIETLSASPPLSTCSAVQSECLQASQLEIFNLLEEGSLQELAQREISYQSADTIEKYGQLRAGFELTQKTLEDAHAKLTQNKIKINELEQALQKQDALTTSALDSPSDSVSEPEAESAHDQLSQVTIHLRDIPSLIFHCQADAPILAMLRDHLVDTTRNEMIYLNCGEAQTDEAIYFMSADLLSIEIENIKPH